MKMLLFSCFMKQLLNKGKEKKETFSSCLTAFLSLYYKHLQNAAKREKTIEY